MEERALLSAELVGKASGGVDETGNCPRCGRYTHLFHGEIFVETTGGVQEYGEFVEFTRLTDDSRLRIEGTDIREQKPYDEWDNYKNQWLFKLCVSCHQSSIYRGQQLIFPNSHSSFPVPSEHMPDKAKDLYNEARTVASVSVRAAAILARASLEQLLLDKVPDATHKMRLEELIKLVGPLVRTSTYKTIQALRFIGNKSVHGIHEDEDGYKLLVNFLEGNEADLLPALMHSINQLVEELIVEEINAAELFDKLPQEFKDKINQSPGDLSG